MLCKRVVSEEIINAKNQVMSTQRPLKSKLTKLATSAWINYHFNYHISCEFCIERTSFACESVPGREISESGVENVRSPRRNSQLSCPNWRARLITRQPANKKQPCREGAKWLSRLIRSLFGRTRPSGRSISAILFLIDQRRRRHTRAPLARPSFVSSGECEMRQLRFPRFSGANHADWHVRHCFSHA